MKQLKNINYKGALALEIDAQYMDVSQEFTAPEYLSEAINRAYKLQRM